MHTVLEITRPSAKAYDRLPINRHNGRHQLDTESIEGAVKTILEAVGEDLQRPGLWDTPRRVAKTYREMFSGLHQDPARHLKVTFPESYDETRVRSWNADQGQRSALRDIVGSHAADR